MKVLMINHFPLEGSGSGTYTKNLATQLAKLGHEVCVILPENSADYPRYEGVRLHPVFFTPEIPATGTSAVASATETPGAPSAPAGALPFNFPCFTTHPRSTTAFDDLTPEQFAAYIGAFQRAIDEEVRDFAPDVVHGQHVWVLPALAADCGVPLVLTAHGTDLMGYEKWPELRSYAARAMEAARAVVCISADNEQLVRTTFPDQAHKAIRVRNGYNPDIFCRQALDRSEVLATYGLAAPTGPLVMFAGKMTRFKGIDVLLDAAARYERELPGVLTVLAGDGELRGELEAQATRLGLQSVRFIGNVSQDELARLYNVADVDLVPSRREAFGLVAVEAMACGVPVVATNEGGLPDFVNETVGALVPVDDPASLASAIVDVLARNEADPTWPDAIAAYAEQNYSQAAIIHEVERIYKAATG